MDFPSVRGQPLWSSEKSTALTPVVRFCVLKAKWIRFQFRSSGSEHLENVGVEFVDATHSFFLELVSPQ